MIRQVSFRQTVVGVGSCCSQSVRIRTARIKRIGFILFRFWMGILIADSQLAYSDTLCAILKSDTTLNFIAPNIPTFSFLSGK